MKIIKIKILGTEVDIYTDDNGRARIHSQLRRTCGCCGQFVCRKRQDNQLLHYNHLIGGVEHLLTSHFELGGKASSQYIEAIEEMVVNCAKVAFN